MHFNQDHEGTVLHGRTINGAFDFLCALDVAQLGWT